MSYLPVSVSVPTGVAEKGFTSLHAAVKNRQIELAKRLIKRGSKVNIVDDSGRSPVHYAVENHDADTVALLFANGATGFGRPNALLVAVERGNETIVEMLLSSGVNVNAKEPDGKTALHTAIESGSERMCKILMEHDADVYARNNKGQTSLHIAAACDNTAIFEIINDVYEDIDHQDQDGETALHIASKLKADRVVDILLAREAEINLTCNAGKTPIDYCTRTAWYDIGSMRRHIIKMTALRRHLSEKNSKQISNVRNSIIQRCCLEDYEEIQLMKSTNIGDSKVSFYDIMTSDAHRLAYYARNKNIREVLTSREYRKKFCSYSEMIDLRFKRGVRRNGLLHSSTKVLNAFSDYALSDDAATEILKYLSNMDLVNLIRAGSRRECDR